MGINELKKNLHEKIDNIKDQYLLESLNTFLNLEDSKESELIVSDKRLKILNDAVKEFEEGNYYTNEEANQIVKDWLKD